MGSRPDAPHVDHPYVFSVSQVETYETCPRKWAFQKIDGLESEPNKFAVLGQEVHGVLEDYLSKAVPIDPHSKIGRIAFPGIKYLPLPRSPGVRVEKWFVLRFGIAAYRGLKDVEIIKDGRVVVLDHKTTRNFRWKKTPQDLVRDIQAGIYSADAMRKTGCDVVHLKWVYYRTEGSPKSEPVETPINRKQVAKILTRTNRIALKMADDLDTKRSALEVTPDYTGCSAYGGCPFRKQCKPKPKHVLRAIMAQKTTESSKKSTSSFLAEMRDRKNKKAGGGKSARREPEEIDVEDTEGVEVNSPDRDEATQPPPPAAKKVDGQWVQPEWDEAAWEWKYPGEEKKEKKAAKSGSSSRKNAAALLANVQKSQKRAQEEEEEEPEEEEEEPEEETEEEDSNAEALLDWFADLIAEKVAARVKSKK